MKTLKFELNLGLSIQHDNGETEKIKYNSVLETMKNIQKDGWINGFTLTLSNGGYYSEKHEKHIFEKSVIIQIFDNYSNLNNIISIQNYLKKEFKQEDIYLNIYDIFQSL